MWFFQRKRRKLKSDDFRYILYYLKRVVCAKDHEVCVSVPAESASAWTSRRTSLFILPGSAHSCVPNNVPPVQSWVKMQSNISSRLACQIHRKSIAWSNRSAIIFISTFWQLYMNLFDARRHWQLTINRLTHDILIFLVRKNLGFFHSRQNSR